MGHARFRNANGSPTVNGANGSLDQFSNSAGAPKGVDDFVCLNVHERRDMRLSQQSQDENCDIRFCDIRSIASQGGMTREELNQLLDERDIKNVELATLLGIEADKISKSRSSKGTRRWTAEEFSKLKAYLDRGTDMSREPDLPVDGVETEYLEIEVLPTYGGAGGGGTGDGSREVALIAKVLVEDMLRGRSGDFVLIKIRGDSMEPDFHHDDELLVDKRDVSPSQPGPFAVWDSEWGEYVVKNVERIAEGHVRMFSSNPKYTPTEIRHEDTRIIGRPVWFARRL